MKLIWSNFKRWWLPRMPLATVTLLCSIAGMVSDLIMPLLGADIINYFFSDHTVDENDLFASLFADRTLTDLQIFGKVALVFGILVVVRICFIYLKNITRQYNAVGMETEMRDVTYRRLMELDSSAIASVNTGELMTIIDRDVINMKDLFSGSLLQIFEAAFVIAVSTGFLIKLSPVLLIMPVLFIPFFYVTLRRYTRRMRELSNDLRDATSDLNLAVNENVRAVRIVRSFANEEREKQRFYASNHMQRDLRERNDRVSAKYSSLFSFYNQLAYVITLAVSAFLVMRGNILLGSLSAATTYVLKIMGQISGISGILGTMQYQTVCMQRIQKFMDLPVNIKDGTNEIDPGPAPHFAMHDVTVTLDGTDVLKHVNLDIPHGKKIGIMGETGSGKSVLLKSLSRVYDASSGEITVNGVNVKDIPLETLRHQFGYVFQDVFLFSHTIDANIAYYDTEAETAAVEDAAKTAEAHNFIVKLPQGYETEVGERGVGISGGQKQRVSIARALLKQAPVLVLDDASSALDMATERRVMEGIKERCPDATILIAAHRVTSVLDCDEVLYLDNGEVVERGTPEELLQMNGRFAHVYQLQQAPSNTVDDKAYGVSDDEGGDAQ